MAGRTRSLACAPLGLDRSAYRFAGITLAIIMLVERTGPAWRTALQRFTGLSIGIAVGLVISALWPERQPPAAETFGAVKVAH